MKASDLYGGRKTTTEVGATSSASSTSSATNANVDTTGQTPTKNVVKEGKFSNSYATFAILGFIGLLVGLKFGLENNN